MEIYSYAPTKVILAGTVKKTDSGISVNGNKYFAITLANQQLDPEYNVMVEKEAETVVFCNSPETAKYPKASADNAARMKPKDGALVIIKATKTINDDGTISYFGNRLIYPGNAIQYKPTDQGPGCDIIVGVTLLDKNDNVVCIQQSKTTAIDVATNKPIYRAVYCQMTMDGVTSPDEVKNLFREKQENGKCHIAAFIAPYNSLSITTDEQKHIHGSAIYTALALIV